MSVNAERPETEETLLVAIDGPAGSGKSSVAREVSARLGYGMLDTGAAYRALTWLALREGVPFDDAQTLLTLVDDWGYRCSLKGPRRVTLRRGGERERLEITSEIRSHQVSTSVSEVSRHAAVRERLNGMFREIVELSGLPGVIVEGRDITTVVAPFAQVRILLTASPQKRAERRAAELDGMNPAQVLADLVSRDARDAEVVDFTSPAEGVTLIDTSELDFTESVQAVIDEIARRNDGRA